MQAGVPTTAIRYLGTIHNLMLNPITDTPAVRGAIAQVSNTLQEIFQSRIYSIFYLLKQYL